MYHKAKMKLNVLFTLVVLIAQRQEIRKSKNEKNSLGPTQVAKIGHGYLFMKEINKH
jgi:hypothetical protein